MQSLDSSALIGLGAFAAIVILFVLIFVFAGRKAKKALVEFAASRGTLIQPKDETGELEKNLTERLGMPPGGIYKDIVPLSLSAGEGWLFSRAPEPDRDSSDNRSSSGSPHQYIVVFMDIPISGRTFTAKAVPIGGGLGRQIVEFMLAKVFGARGIHYLDVTAEYPEFSKVYNVFTEDEAGARSAILSSGVISCLMNRPRKDPPSLSFGPKGFGMDLEGMLKSRQEIELFVQWADDLARELERG
jgi:hypothetical protein